MALFPHRHFNPDGSLAWRATIEASLAAHPIANRRIPARFEPLARRLSVGGCLHCRTPWGLVRGHATLAEGRHVVVLCEACWLELPVPARLVYYDAQYRLWLHGTSRIPYGPQRDKVIVALQEAQWAIKRAVAGGG